MNYALQRSGRVRKETREAFGGGLCKIRMGVGIVRLGVGTKRLGGGDQTGKIVSLFDVVLCHSNSISVISWS